MKRFIPIGLAVFIFGALAVAQVVVRGGGPTEELTVSTPLSIYDDGGVVNIAMTPASAVSSGYLALVGGVLTVDAGIGWVDGTTSSGKIYGVGSFLIASSKLSVGGAVSGSQLQVRNAGNAFLICDADTGNLSNTGQFSSSTASGNNAFAVGVNGARVDFGAGANDYATSNGSTVDFANFLNATAGLSAGTAGATFDVNGTTGNVISTGTILGAGLFSSTGLVGNTLATATLNLASDMNAATASSTNPAVTACATVALDSNDLAFGVGQPGSCSTERFSVDAEGDVLAASSLGLASRMHWSATAPTIASGGCTSPAVVSGADTALFVVTIGTACTGVTDITFTMPTSSRVWNCYVNTDDAATRIVSQILTGSSTTAQFRNFSRTTGVAADWTAGSAIQVSCNGGGG